MTVQPSNISVTPIRVQYQITPDQMLEALRRRLLSRDTFLALFGRARRRNPRFVRTTLVLNCLFGGVLLFAAAAAWLGVHVKSIFFMLELMPAAFAVLVVFSLRRTLVTYMRKHEDHPMFHQVAVVEVDDRGVRSTRASCRYELEWSGAMRISETANLLLIIDYEPRAVIMPKRMLSDEQLRELRRLARENIPS